MSEIEVPIEKIQEEIQHKALHARAHEHHHGAGQGQGPGTGAGAAAMEDRYGHAESSLDGYNEGQNPQSNSIHEAHESAESASFISFAAILSAMLAVLAAVAALYAGHYANEAMLEQINASNKWSYYQSKSIKYYVLESKRDILIAMNKIPDPKIEDKLKEYKGEQKEIFESAKEKEKDAILFLLRHQILAKAVTLFQVAIGVAAIGVLTRKRYFLLVTCGFGVVGVFFLTKGLFFT